MNRIVTACVSLFLLVTASGCESSTETSGPTGASSSEMALRSSMDMLWEDHIAWTRNVIFAVIDELPGATEATNRLLANQDDIGNAIKPYYGDAAGAALSKLLRSHIMTAAGVLTAAKSGDQTALAAENAKWSANADSIAVFLSAANPTNWPEATMKQMMQSHLQHTTAEAVARVQKDYAADIAAYDMVHEQILEMSKALSDGIIKQFPEKF